MGFFDFLRPTDINRRLEEFDAMPEAVLLDVRTPQEYSEGHIPCSENVPLQHIDEIRQKISVKDTPLFVYCHSGARSSEAASMLREMGYTRVMNIGGICSYLGKVERGSERRICWHGSFCSVGTD